MIYEIRTYDLHSRIVPDYQQRFGEKLPGRLKFSPLGGHWYTEIGPINQIVAIWPYDSQEHRNETRKRVEEAGVWPPDTGEFVVSMQSEIFLPAPFMTPLAERDIGPIYEMRIYTYPPEDMPMLLESWGSAMEDRERFSPLAGCWYKESGGQGNFAHMWAYRDFEERVRIRAVSRATGAWPPVNPARLVNQQNKILLPASFSPMQ